MFKTTCRRRFEPRVQFSVLSAMHDATRHEGSTPNYSATRHFAHCMNFCGVKICLISVYFPLPAVYGLEGISTLQWPVHTKQL